MSPLPTSGRAENACGGAPPLPPLVRLAVLAIRLYQGVTPPLVRGGCRFAPSCSQYARESLERHGLARGLVLTVRRLARCHPLGASGYDPAP